MTRPERDQNTRRVIDARDWRIFLLKSDQVEEELLRLHQFGRLRFERAGTHFDRSCSAMKKGIYRYSFRHPAIACDIEASLLLAILATESLHGESRVRLDAGHFFDRAKRVCIIDAGTSVGRDLNRLFTGFLNREFGPDAFTVERVEAILGAFIWMKANSDMMVLWVAGAGILVIFGGERLFLKWPDDEEN